MGINFFFTFPTSEGSDLLSSHVMQTPTFISKLSDGNVIFRLDVGKKYFVSFLQHSIHKICNIKRMVGKFGPRTFRGLTKKKKNILGSASNLKDYV
jgi:hypothetical protein